MDSQDVTSFPEEWAPYFYIETCSNCEKHKAMYQHHYEEKYIHNAEILKEKLLGLIPELAGGREGSDRVLINQFHVQLSSQDSQHDYETYHRIRKSKFELAHNDRVFTKY